MKVLLIAMLALVVLTVGTTAYAGTNDWTYILEIGNNLTLASSKIVVGVSPSASDNYDSNDYFASGASDVMLRVYHSPAEGWTGPEGFYIEDIRQPLTTEMTWANIYLWWDSIQPGYDWPMRFSPYLSYVSPPNYHFTLYLDHVPTGIAYGGPWSWQLPNTGTLTIPTGTFTPFASSAGLDGYKFHLTVTNVPEPGSLLVLLGALGAAGVASLRRRR